MALHEFSERSEKTTADAGDRQYAARPSRLPRRIRPLATLPPTELLPGNGHIHAGSVRLAKRDRCLVLVDPRLLERVCQALATDEDAPELVFPVGSEPPALRGLLGGSVRDTVEAYGVRRVLFAASGLGGEEQMLELTVNGAMDHATVSTPPLGLRRSAEMVKRGFDLVIACLALVIGAPLLALLGLLVKLGSPGSVLFRQTRVGRGGQPFEMLKFRTMVQDAEARKVALLELNERDGLFKIREDPRVTSIGRWLRQTNLDELPQLINVLRGEMSLVGPRPLVPDEDVRIRGWRRRRLTVRPGMTGCWQVGTPRVSLDEMIVIDHLYTANWSLWKDLKCIVGTVPSMLLRRGL